MKMPKPLPHNATEAEILGNVEHHYPKLGPVLRQLFERLQELHVDGRIESLKTDEDDDEAEDPVEAAIRDLNEQGVVCQHCGGTVHIMLEEKK